ncbi:MAG: hypothetical protein MPF33_07790 [Candidatus Aramenus sp.]|jgi:hypothetical protein|nr:hypothetical protein [Candidatus Aramenus sp.]
MSNTEFFKLQDLILKRTSLEKVKIHLESRRERAVYSWIASELKEFVKTKDDIFRPYIDKILEGIRTEDYEKVLEGVNASIALLDKKIDEMYKRMAKS